MGEVDKLRSEEMRKDTQMALLYEIRLMISKGEKKTYTKEELLQLLDTIADAKAQE